MTQAREGVDGVVITVFDGNPLTTNDPTFLYVTGGKTSSRAATALRTTERAKVDIATGNLVNPDDPNATTMAEDTTHLLQKGRAYYPLLTNQGQFVTPFPPPPQEPPCGDLDGDGPADINCGGDDCDDANVNVHPGAPEQCTNTVDDNCNDLIDCLDNVATVANGGCSDAPECACNPADADGDGHDALQCGGDDCDDADANNFPGNPEQCTDQSDNDCDALVDCDDTQDCGADPGCVAGCELVADADGDGHKPPPCGDDCDDTNAAIHPGAIDGNPNCDGIDQDCNGFDTCINIGSVGGSGGGSGGSGSGFTILSSVPETNDPILLVAVAGNITTSGAGAYATDQTLEVTSIDRVTGALSSNWTLQTLDLTNGGKSMGLDGLLYFGFLYSLPGSGGETINTQPTQPTGNTTRFQFSETPASQSTFLVSKQSAAATLSSQRSHYSLVRLNAKIFAFGGNNGSGPTDNIDVNQQ
jgi:hypothetical protein